MPDEAPLDVTLSEDDLSELDDALKDGPGAGPEEFFRLGQLVPDAPSIEDAIAKLYSPHPEKLTAAAKAFGSLAPRPYQGLLPNPGELEEIVGEQDRVTPAYLNTPRYSGDPRSLVYLHWRRLEDYQNYDRTMLRDQTGHGRPRAVREVPFQAFLTFACGLKPIDWVETLMFTDEPHDKPVDDSPGIKERNPDKLIRFLVAYVRAPIEVQSAIPPWIVEVVEAYPDTRDQTFR